MAEAAEPKKLRCSKRQLALLQRCSGSKDMSEWNDWRNRHRRLPVYLEGASLWNSYLCGADLRYAYLETAELVGAQCQPALGASTDFRCAHLEGASFLGAHLEEAYLNYAYLRGACFDNAHLEDAYLSFATLEESEFLGTVLNGTHFRFAKVDGGTTLTDSRLDLRTDTRGTPLSTARIDPPLLESIKYINRRLAWQDWHEKRPVLKWLSKPFWWMSDYGASTGRIVFSFFVGSMAFACVYAAFPFLVADLLPDGLAMSQSPIWFIVRCLYFSIVTMTTLGFGDMAANPTSIMGHIVLCVEVIMGYVMLGALVTRLGILFTGSGPMAEVKGRYGTGWYSTDVGAWLCATVGKWFRKKKADQAEGKE